MKMSEMSDEFTDTARLSREEARLIKAIAGVVAAMDEDYQPEAVALDLANCHLNGCPLDLSALAAAPTEVLLEEVLGISEHINWMTGQLEGGFVPRFAAAGVAQ
jgi:hypothetical protein